MNPKIETSKRELTLFFVIAFAVPYLMGIPLAISQRAGNDTSVFANAQMFDPAIQTQTMLIETFLSIIAVTFIAWTVGLMMLPLILK